MRSVTQFILFVDEIFALPFDTWALSAIKFPLQNFRSPQLIEYTIILLFEKARTDAEPPHPSHEFRDFANLLAPDSAAELSKWSAVSLWT